MEAKHWKEGSEYASKDVNYGSEDLLLFGKEKVLPCVQTNIVAHSFKQGVMEYSNSMEEGGMNDVQVVEVKRPRHSTRVLARKNLRRDWTTRKKLAVESLGTDIYDTPPHALRVPISLSQDIGKDLGHNVDVSPPKSESEQVICLANILVLNSQEPIIVRGFETQQENDFNPLARMQSQTLWKQIGIFRDGGSGKGNVCQVVSLLHINITRAPTSKLEFSQLFSACY